MKKAMSYADWHWYVNLIEFLPRPDLLDIIFVDGRFRVACALKAIPYLLQSNGFLILHDANRAAYKPIFEFYDEVSSAGALKVLTPKPVEPGSAVLSKYLKYLDDPS